MILFANLLLIVAAASTEDCRRRRRRLHRLRQSTTFVHIPPSFAPLLQQSRAQMRSNSCSLSRLFASSEQTHASNKEAPQYGSAEPTIPSEITSPTVSAISSSSTTDARIHDLITHPAVTWEIHTTFTSMHKKKLGRRHLHLFQRNNSNNNNIIDDYGNRIYTDHLFDQFAQVVCYAGIVARKEVFETWASALYIHSTFFNRSNDNNKVDVKETNIFDNETKIRPIVNRIVDVAAGHGLLAWALLILDDQHRRNSGVDHDVVDHEEEEDDGAVNAVYPQLHPSPLTAFCIDVQMPQSAEIIHSCMIQQFPHLVSRFDYVESRLEQLIPHPSCLLVSIHGCGILSDILVATAAKHQVPLALVPCCHSRKRIVLDVASPFAKSLYDDIILKTNDNGNSKSSSSMSDLADQLDKARIIALINSGHVTKEIFLPKLFTDKNRMILSIPSKSNHSLIDVVSSSYVHLLHQPHEFVRRGQLTSSVVEEQRQKQQVIIIERDKANGSILPKSRFLKGFSVPCKDDYGSRRIVNQLSGRIAANSRKEMMHLRFHKQHPQFHLSLWLPPELPTSLSEQSLSQIVESTNSNVTCTVTKVGSIYINLTTGRQAQTFCVQYALCDENNNSTTRSLLSFDDAKCMHEKLYSSIPMIFPGSECR